MNSIEKKEKTLDFLLKLKEIISSSKKDVLVNEKILQLQKAVKYENDTSVKRNINLVIATLQTLDVINDRLLTIIKIAIDKTKLSIDRQRAVEMDEKNGRNK